MAKKRLKIMSWNIEKLSIITRFNGNMQSQQTDILVIKYISEIIKEHKPAIVCLIEADIRTKTFIKNQLQANLGTDWVISESPGIKGGDKGLDGQVGANEVYLVLSDKTKIKISGTPELVDKYINVDERTQKPTAGYTSKPQWLLRPPLSIKFSFSPASDVKFGLLVIHLGAGNWNSTNFRRLIKLDALISSTSPIFLVGDFNAAAEIISNFIGNENIESLKGVDILSQPYVTNKSSRFINLDQISSPIIKTDSLGYRTEHTGVDDIISFKNKGKSPIKRTREPYLPKTGIIDLIYEYQDTFFSDPPKNSTTELNSLNPEYLKRSNGGTIQYYGKWLLMPPSQDSDSNKKKLWFNAWLRYMGGISDHLPVIMTIDIDV